jgi:hypothetical protein
LVEVTCVKTQPNCCITALPITALPITALPITALPITALPITALPITALPISALPISALLAWVGKGSATGMESLVKQVKTGY